MKKFTKTYFFKTCLSLPVALLLISNTFAQSVRPGTFVPSGSYASTSRYHKVILECTCKDRNKLDKKSSLDITSLVNPSIVNEDGVLKASGTQKATTFTPAGTYTESCSNIKVTMTSDAMNAKGAYGPSSVDLTDLPLTTQIANFNGVITVKK